MSKKVEMKDIVNLSQARGFVYAGSEIYGGLANSWDYGPYGSLLKENIKNLWIKEFVQKKDDMMLLDSSILLNPKVWVASGHVGGFSDPLTDCKSCKTRHRADKLIEDNTEINPEGLEVTAYLKNLDFLLAQSLVKKGVDIGQYYQEDFSEINDLAEDYFNELIPGKQDIDLALQEKTKKLNFLLSGKNINEKLNYYFKNLGLIKCPNCGAHNFTEIRNFNLMFKTSIGVTEDSSSTVYMRPETAQGIFVDFANVLRTSRRKIPFGVAQVGKAFRNEITPGNFIFRTREFEQMEIEYFCEPGKDLEVHAEWKEACKNFLLNTLQINEENIRLRDHDQDELSHYSNATTDIEYKFPFGWGELWGIADRTDFDLKAHMNESKQDMSYFDPVNNRKFVPYVIEPSVGLNRLFLTVLADAYTVEGEGEEARTYLKLAPRVAPIKVGVLPVVKKIGDLAKQVYAQLAEDFVCEYDEVGTIGKRYARFDEIGTPFCVTIDSTNFEAGNVTVRFRDSMEQETVALKDLNEFIRVRVK